MPVPFLCKPAMFLPLRGGMETGAAWGQCGGNRGSETPALFLYHSKGASEIALRSPF